MVSSETYQAIQKWITRQQEYEATHSDPAPLTDIQRKLLEKLALSLPPDTNPPPEPELDETNWIGILLEYRAARQRIREGMPGGDFVEEPGPTLNNVQRWYCHVRIDEHPAPFPGPAGGLSDDGQRSCFARKKDAKKYAAKCAVQWLRANGYMPQVDRNAVKSPQVQQSPITPASSPVKKKQKLAAPPPESNEKQTPPGAPLPKGIASPYNDTEVSVIHQVSELCERAGYRNFPQYKITENSQLAGFFDGYADLGLLAQRLPKGVGRVEKVLGKKPAKEKIAESLLNHLRKLVAENDERDEQFLANLSPVKKEEEPSAPA
ncbi:hypothetical protein M426DRAFT_159028 [Hypoxylon sp. CI-4A]|nr:hypothetical protein M426DRAFT_159028 [Hypoxylon sp. CI-4A]